MDFSYGVTDNNIENVRRQMMSKLDYSMPFIPTAQMTAATVNDMDNFPYRRYFRGRYYEQHPIVFEREAGWRPREDDCYKKEYQYSGGHYPYHCFEAACSIVYPCYPDYLRRYADKEELDLFLNRECVLPSP